MVLSRVRSSVLAAVVVLAAPGAHAQSAADRATARELGLDGQNALDKKDYVAAEDRFRRADALFHAPTLLLGFARAEAGLGKVVNASEAYNRLIREGLPPGAPQVFVSAVEAAKAEVGAVVARIANVTVVVTGPDNPTVTLDDQPLPVASLGVKRPVDPGPHVVKASADGWEPAETKFTVADAASANAALTMKRAAVGSAAAPVGNAMPAPVLSPALSPESDQGTTPTGGGTATTLGWVGIVAGGVGLATGAVTGGLALGKHSTLNSECPQANACNGHQSDIDSYHTLGAVSTVAFIAGGVLAGAGLVLILTAPSGAPSRPAASLTPYVGLGSIGAVGSF
jgi:hypothetical protein